jgi:hypothetical protein
MILTPILASLLSLQAAPEASQETEAKAEPNIEVIDKKPKKKKKITDKSHPDYVRCKSESVIGSRARRKRTCMTNREWAVTARRGNEASRDFVGDNQAGFQPGTGGL